MRLSDMVAGMSPAQLTIIAMVIFLVTFTGVVIYSVARKNRDKFEKASRLPFDDGSLEQENLP